MGTAILSKPGTLVQARGREWVVLPESTDELLMVRPVGGLDERSRRHPPGCRVSRVGHVPAANGRRRRRLSPPADCFAMPPACPRAQRPARSAALGASPLSRGPISWSR